MAENSNSIESPSQSKSQGMSFEQALLSQKSDWEKRLREENFKGDIARAAHIIRRFADGAQWIYNKRKAIGMLEIGTELPGLDFDSTNIPDFGAAYLADYNMVVIGTYILDKVAKHELDKLIDITRTDGNVGFRGTPDEFGFLFGVEEFDHGLGEKANHPLHPNHVSRAEYNAQDHEYQALRWRILAAEENNFNPETIKFLKEMYDEASDYRTKTNHTKKQVDSNNALSPEGISP